MSESKGEYVAGKKKREYLGDEMYAFSRVNCRLLLKVCSHICGRERARRVADWGRERV